MLNLEPRSMHFWRIDGGGGGDAFCLNGPGPCYVFDLPQRPVSLKEMGTELSAHSAKHYYFNNSTIIIIATIV